MSLTRRLATLLLLPMTLALGACGPKVTSSYSLGERPIDVVYGPVSSAAPAPSPRPPASEPTVDFPGFIGAPVPAALVDYSHPSTPRPTPPVDPCPPPPLGTTAEKQFSPGMIGMPTPQSYKFRRTGTVKVAGVSRDLAGDSQVLYENSHVVTTGYADPAYQFDVVISDGKASTTTTYQVVNGGAPGLQIVQVVTKMDQQSTQTYRPAAPIRIMTLPAAVQASPDNDAGVDPLGGTAETVQHQNQAPVNVPTCGSLVQGWLVQVNGTIRNVKTSENLALQAEYVVATQYGGVIVDIKEKLDGLDSQGRDYHLDTESLIDSVPVNSRPAQ